MGTYGKGEISSLCEWVQPQIGVVTAIGPVHLERMRSLDTIVEAKSEILECVADCSAERRRLRPRRRRRRQPPRGQARHRMQRGEAHEPRRRPRPAGRRPLDDRRGRVVHRDPEPRGAALEPRVRDRDRRGRRRAVGRDRASTRVAPPARASPGSRSRRLRACTSSTTPSARTRPAPSRRSPCSRSRVPSTRASVVVTPGMVELGKQQFRRERALGQRRVARRGRHRRRRADEPTRPRPGRCRRPGRRPPVATREEAVAWVRSELEARRRRALRERPARPLPLIPSAAVPACPGDPSRRAVRRPIPEHDISVLTGLQAARALAKDRRRRHRDLLGQDRRLLRGRRRPRGRGLRRRCPPQARTGSTSWLGPAAGSSPRRAASDAAGARDRRRRQLLPRRPGRGRHPAGRARPGRHARTPGPSAAGAALGMDKLAFGGVMAGGRAARAARASRSTAERRPPPFAGPVHREAPLRRLVDRHRDHRRPDRGRAPSSRASPHSAPAPCVEPYLPDAVDLNMSVRLASRGCGCRRSSGRCEGRGGGRIYSLRRQVPRRRGDGDAPSASCRPAGARRESSDADHRAAATTVARVALRAVGGPHRLPLPASDQLYVNEINTIPGSLAWYLWAAEGDGVRSPAPRRHAGRGRTGPSAHYSTDGADGTALRAAGSIAAKLA